MCLRKLLSNSAALLCLEIIGKVLPIITLPQPVRGSVDGLPFRARSAQTEAWPDALSPARRQRAAGREPDRTDHALPASRAAGAGRGRADLQLRLLDDERAPAAKARATLRHLNANQPGKTADKKMMDKKMADRNSRHLVAAHFSVLHFLVSYFLVPIFLSVIFLSPFSCLLFSCPSFSCPRFLVSYFLVHHFLVPIFLSPFSCPSFSCPPCLNSKLCGRSPTARILPTANQTDIFRPRRARRSS